MVYRANLVNHLINSLVWGLFLFIQVYLLTSKVSSIAGWDRPALLLLTGVYDLVIGIFYLLFSRGFRDIAEIILMGKLDLYLLKPLDSQFHLSLREVNLPGSVRCFLGILIISLLSFQYHLTFSFTALCLFIVSTIGSVIFLYSAWFLVLTLLIWAPRVENLVDLLYTLTGLGKYPREILKPFPTSILTFLILPTLLTVSIPTKILLNNTSLPEIIGFNLFGLILLILSRKFWKFGLKFYTGGSI
jgi:ABC-2 type transport system permease protein